MCFRACAPNTPPLVLPPTYMYMKIFCTLSHTESSAADFSFSSVSPQTVEHTGVCIGWWHCWSGDYIHSVNISCLDQLTPSQVHIFIIMAFAIPLLTLDFKTKSRRLVGWLVLV